MLCLRVDKDFADVPILQSAHLGSKLGGFTQLFFSVGSEVEVLRSLLLTLQSCHAIAEIFEAGYEHDIYFAPSDSFFITCDNPTVTIEPDTDGTAWVGMGLGHPHTEVIFPLSKRACLILSRERARSTDPPIALRHKLINEMLVGVAQKYAYAPVGYKELARIINERGFKIKYGENALLASDTVR